MAMEQWSPFREMMTLRDAMDRLFQESFVRPTNALLGRGAPALDLRETENGYEIEAALPGVKPEDVQITVQGDTLTIRGETKAEEERKNQNWLVRERHSGAFYRTLTLPTAVNADQAQARFEHGVLHLTLPKAVEAKPRQIRIGGDGGPSRQIPTQGTTSTEQSH